MLLFALLLVAGIEAIEGELSHISGNLPRCLANESPTQSGAFAIQRLDDKGRPAVKMVGDSLVQPALASGGR